MSKLTNGDTVLAEQDVYVNDQARRVPAGATVTALISEMGLTGKKGVAVAVNGQVVSRNNWPQHVLAADDRVLVIQATQGG